MSRRMVRRATLWMTVGLFILGCAAPDIIAPPPSAPTLGSIDSIIEQTAEAAQTQTAISLPATSTPSSTSTLAKTTTLSPTPTATFLFITETSLPAGFLIEDFEDLEDLEDLEDDETDSDSDEETEKGDPTKTPRPKEWKCRVLSKSPAMRAVITGGSSFEAIWTVENAGTKTWPKKGVDIVFVSGNRLNEGKPYLDIPSAVGPGGKVTISIPMNAPKYPKTYSQRWSLKVGKKEFCIVKFVIVVK